MKFNWLAIIVLALAFIGCRETVNNEFPTLAAAKTEIEKGWIPRILPSSTIEIHESHNLDVNTGHGTFAFSQSDSEQFKKSLALVEEGESFRGIKINRSRLKQEGFELYKFESFYLAINWDQCQGQFWLKSSM